eukprot:INCI15474.1.p1 GENE.INCI15474.1~~INCI15474.1.p1  ORF type:complete len:912 (+),score=148.99 INCI15474.1:242-2977(+)
MGDAGESKRKDEFVVDDDGDDNDNDNDNDDDVDEEVRRSYVEVNGPVPSGPAIDDNGLAQQVAGGPPQPGKEGVALIGLANSTGAPTPAKSVVDEQGERAPDTAANESANESARLKKRGNTRVALVGMPKPAAGDASKAKRPSRLAPISTKLSYQEVHGAVPTGPVVDENGLAQQVSSGARPQQVSGAAPVVEAKPSGSASAPHKKPDNAHIARLGHALESDSASQAASPGCRCVSGTTSPGGTFRRTSRAFVNTQRAVRGQQAAPSSSSAHEIREVSHGLWIIWLGVGVSACLASLGCHWFISQSALWICGIVWGCFNIPLSEFFRSLFFTAAAIFFKDFDVAGAHRVPAEGPVMLVCGPHANQFIDPIVVSKALSHRKDIGFLSAASTMRKKYIGTMAEAMNAIPVERAQDLAVAGKGTVKLELGKRMVTGVGTEFRKAFAQPKSSLAVKVPSGSGKHETRVVRVAEVLSDTKLMLSKPILYIDEETVDAVGNIVPADADTVSASFTVFPHIDLGSTFAAVHAHLHNHNVVGIFPEGGSHDQTKMLPLKVGCAVMALGACASCPGLPLRIIPVGINYFRGHRFRSRVFIDVGEAIIPSKEQIAKFNQGGANKFEACDALLAQIKVGLKTVTLESENFNDLQFIRAVRRLYASGGEKPSAFDRFRMTKAFSACYERDRDVPIVAKLYDGILDYRKKLHTYRVSDHAVWEAGQAHDEAGLAFELVNQAGRKLVYLFVKILLFVVVSVPGLIASLPIMITVRLVASSKARAALKNSSVKVAGRDVMATWKILVSFVVVPIVHIVYTLLSYYFVGEPAAVAWFFIMPIFAYVTINTTERLKADLQEFMPLLMSTCCTTNTSGDMVAHRSQLQSTVREVVHSLAWDADLKSTKVYRKFSASPFTWEEDDWNGLI